MNVIALIDNLKAGIQFSQQCGVGRHAHSGRWNAVPRHGRAIGITSHVVAVRHAAHAGIVLGIAIGARHALTINAPESRQTGRPSDLLVRAPSFFDRKDPRP